MVLKFFIQNGRQWHIDIPGYLDRHPGSDADLFVDDYYSHKFFDFFIRGIVRIETNEFEGYHVKLEKYGTGEFEWPLSEIDKQNKGVCYKITKVCRDISGDFHYDSRGFDKVWLCEALKELFNGQHPDVLYMRTLFRGDENTLNPVDREKYLEFIRDNTSIEKNNSGCSAKSIVILVAIAIIISLLKKLYF